ncbi:MAG: glycosyltransferase [Clostridia bacterium]|nr:glycosyltransferase [Clostridia bacterium]
MKKEPKISIIVPVYKVEQFLEKCVNSITAQTYKNLEIILVDDGSPDNSPALCDNLAKTDKRIKVIHKANGGVSSARNEGLRQASGEYVAFVDSDDWIEETMYEEMLNLAIAENADMVFCKMKEARSDGTYSNYNEFNLDKLKDKKIEYFFISAKSGFDRVGVLGGPCRTLFKKSVINGLEFDTTLKYGEDLCFLLKVFEKANNVSVCDKYFYNYYKNVDSVCNTINKSYFVNAKVLHKYLLEYNKTNNLNFVHFINHLYMYRNVINRAHEKDFARQMKELIKTDEYFKDCFNKKNYKLIQKYEIGLKQKIRNFLMYHKMWRIFKLLANKK